MDYHEQYRHYVAIIEETIEKILPQSETDCPTDGGIPEKLCKAMRYSLLAGGKRVRPVLLLAKCWGEIFSKHSFPPLHWR